MAAKQTPSRSKGASYQAVALRYAPREDRAPQIMAKGRGDVAERIVQLAREHKIPIREDKDMIQVRPAPGHAAGDDTQRRGP